MSTSRTIRVSIFKCQTWWKMNHWIMDPSGLVVMMSLSCHRSWLLGMSWQLKLFWGSMWNSHDLRMSAIAGWISMFFCSCSKLCSWTWNGRLNKNLFRPGIVEYSSLEIALGVNHVVFGCVWMCLKVLPLLVSTWIFSLMMEFPRFERWVDLTECLQMVVWDLNKDCCDDPIWNIFDPNSTDSFRDFSDF